ncbi:PEP-CTERM/exosortase system-associated acyltransferase [Pistricoccus aurantiacus]|uniref:PEP-CTERM/exosortase system-associated acyltransferase n=1 Tax=Pistricoccus aurantiacus TaxID=1883414 RepID=A0A5B8SKW8_9GAMM|nr:PEP-CTERM/exosortase system-associated acyltransferase [Pistricoccus aurantiacus]QEA37742.1 PEP-CTERM/exosortase system-associated acyltransferase [Pistricoccus aurantiacus]
MKELEKKEVLIKKSRNNYFQSFSRNFKFKLAISQEDKNRVYGLRYKVFCQELKGDMPQDRIRGLEYDHYDLRSILCFIEHARTGIIAGCMRLIMPCIKDPCNLQRLSLEDLVPAESYVSKLNPYIIPRNELCEVSRLAISPLFRKNSKKNLCNQTEVNELFTQKEIEDFSYLVVGLFLATYALVGLTNRRHVYAFMEERLPRLLSRSGFYFDGVSKTIEFHGKRKVFYIDHSQAEKEMHESLKPLYKRIWQELEPQLAILMKKQPKLANASSPLAALVKASV